MGTRLSCGILDDLAWGDLGKERGCMWIAGQHLQVLAASVPQQISLHYRHHVLMCGPGYHEGCSYSSILKERGTRATGCMRCVRTATIHCLIRTQIAEQHDLLLIHRLLLQTQYCHGNHTGSEGQYEATRSSPAVPALVLSKCEMQKVPWKPAAAWSFAARTK